MYLFNTDSVISVRKENNRYFKATENGLKPILDQNKFSKLEREDLYRYSGGMILTKINYYKNNFNFFGGKNGHVIIDEKSSFELKSKEDIKKYNFI